MFLKTDSLDMREFYRAFFNKQESLLLYFYLSFLILF